MEDEAIGLVLARATELRSNITNSTHTHSNLENDDDDDDEQEQEDDEEEKAERLLNICAALDSLETQLSSFQLLHQQQRYEREVSFAEIENCRKMIINQLKEYKGKELEVLQEVSNFASETVEHDNDLLLPPYPSGPPCILCLEKDYMSLIQNEKITINPMIEVRKSLSEKEQNHVQARAKTWRKGLGSFITCAAKTMLTVVGVVSILTLSGLAPDMEKFGTRLNGQLLLQGLDNEDERSTSQCPPGRILVVENGEARCIAKERIEVPFSAVPSTPDINYGSG